jgi:hypothetical protein
MVMTSLYVIKLYNPSNCCGMAVNYHGIVFLKLAPDKINPNTVKIYCHILTLEKEGLGVSYHGIFIT